MIIVWGLMILLCMALVMMICAFEDLARQAVTGKPPEPKPIPMPSAKLTYADYRRLIKAERRYKLQRRWGP